VLAALNGSIVGLCEVEDRDALRQLIKKLELKGCNYRYHVIIDTAKRSATFPALLSYFPIRQYAAISVTLPEKKITRHILEADLTIKNKNLKLFINHWPSKHHPESFRVAAAKALMQRVSKLSPGTDYLLLGDFNSDYDEFSTFSTFGKNDTRGRTGINHYLGTTHKITSTVERPITEEELLGKSSPVHYDLWCELPPEIRMSYFYRGNKQTPDHILLPPALYDLKGINYVDNSFETFTWGSRLLSHGKPFRWKMRHREKKKYHVGEGYSDHLPIKAMFTVNSFVFDTVVEQKRYLSTVMKKREDPSSWFEHHTNGWVAAGSAVKYTRSTSEPYAGNYALHLVVPSLKKNCTVMRTVIPSELRERDGALQFCLRGSAKICFRIRGPKESWTYYDVVKNTASGKASYSWVNFNTWYQITLYPKSAPSGEIELELRSAKNAPCNLWIDR
jgi:hypothetical protein